MSRLRPRPTDHQPYDTGFHRAVIDHVADGVYYVDRDRTIRYWNHGAERISGYGAAEVIGRQCFDGILDHVDEGGRSICLEGCPLAATIRDGDPREVEIWLRHRDGHRCPVRVRAAPVRDGDGEIVGAVEVFEDISRRRDRQLALPAVHDALTDPLTGIANRRHFDAALGGRLADLRRYGWRFGILLADIDHLARVNEVHGLQGGDAVLRTVGRTLAGAVRLGDFTARWAEDDDEFVIIAGGTDDGSLAGLAERLRALVAASTISGKQRSIDVRMTFGGAWALRHDTPGSLLDRARRRLSAAKAGPSTGRVPLDTGAPVHRSDVLADPVPTGDGRPARPVAGSAAR